MIESKIQFEQELNSFLQKEFPNILAEEETFIQNRISDLFCSFITV